MKESVLRYLLAELNHSMAHIKDFSRVDNMSFYWHYLHIEFIICLLNRCGIVVFYDDVLRSWKVVK